MTVSNIKFNYTMVETELCINQLLAQQSASFVFHKSQNIAFSFFTGPHFRHLESHNRTDDETDEF